MSPVLLILNRWLHDQRCRSLAEPAPSARKRR